jgi:hypothetical protein
MHLMIAATPFFAFPSFETLRVRLVWDDARSDILGFGSPEIGIKPPTYRHKFLLIC